MFQPAEEGSREYDPAGSGGATPMVQEGAIGDINNPSIDAAIVLHVVAGFLEMKVGNIGVKDGEMTAAADEIYIEIVGKGGHGSAPHKAVDPVYIASQINVQLQGLLSRVVDPMESFVLTIGKIEGGTRTNIIPDTAKMEGTPRTLNRELRKNLNGRIASFVETISEAHGAIAKVKIVNGYDVGINDKSLNQHIRAAFKQYYDEDKMIEIPLPILGAEDFLEFGLEGKLPTSMFWLGGHNVDKGFVYPNHSNYFDIDEDCLPIGTAVLTQTAINYLNSN